MTFYTRIDDNTLVVTKSTADSSAAVWTKNLPDLTLNTLEDTFLSTDAENKYRLFLWQPVDQNILMVFPRLVLSNVSWPMKMRLTFVS